MSDGEPDDYFAQRRKSEIEEYDSIATSGIDDDMFHKIESGF